jgi:hypothetical protein
LSSEEFDRILGMTKPEFYALPRWQQIQSKIEMKLF